MVLLLTGTLKVAVMVEPKATLLARPQASWGRRPRRPPPVDRCQVYDTIGSSRDIGPG
jgi:hypothetical protein